MLSLSPWSRLVAALGAAAPALRLRPGATETQLVAGETMMACRLPVDYRSWLALADGQEPDGLALLPHGAAFLGLDQVISQWVFERGFDVPDDEPGAAPDAMVREGVFAPSRIPIGGWEAHQASDAILDLAPGPRGTRGQVIALESECDFVVIGASLGAYFTRVAELLERGELAPQRIDGDLRLASPIHGDRWRDLVTIAR